MKVGGPVAGISDKMSLALSAGVRRFSPTVREAEVPAGRMISLPGRGSTFVSTAGEFGGDRPPLMLLHALACTAGLTWFTAFPRLSEHHPVAMFDQRWHGRGIRAGRRFRIEDLADDTVALADVLGIERFVPVGYSLGGAVAQMVWKRHPDRVSGLVLAATSRTFRGSGLESTFFRLLPPLLSPLALMSPPTLHAAALEAGLLGVYEGGHLEGPDFRRWALNELRMTSRTTTMNALSALGTFDSCGWVGDIDVPTSVVVTLRDKAIRTVRQRALAEAIPDVQVFEVDGGHTSLVTHADEFSQTLLQACDFVTTGVRPAPVPVG
jgi:pimeloyl-ACP methyl ester carboxylesterase